MSKITHLTPDARGTRSGAREPAEENSAQDETVGQALRSARLARGDDVATVARALRLRRDHIEAIEDGRLEALPGRAYAVGFVRSYAQYLGLGAAAWAERFKAEIVGRSDVAPQIGPPPPDLAGSRIPSGWTVMAILVVGVVLYGGWHLARSADMFSPQTVAPVPARLATAGRQPAAKAPHPAGKQGAATASAKLGTAKTALQAPSGAPADAGGGNGGPSSASPSAAQPVSPGAAPSASAQPAGQVYGEKNRDARVVLLVRAPTHVLVEGPGGKVYINRVLHPGDSYRVPDIVGLSLTAQDGGAVSLELDGQDVGAAGPAGQMADALSLDPQAIVDRAHGASSGDSNRVIP